MTFALQQLFKTPQNNLRLFKVKLSVFIVLLKVVCLELLIH